MSGRLSVVVPAFNEAALLGGLVLELERAVVELVDGSEVIVVDDCSTDTTPVVLATLAAERPWLRVIRSQRNRGHGPSVRAGLDAAAGDWIFQLDSDGQFVVAEFSELWRRREDADLVLGVRVQRRDPRHRLLLSQAVRIAVWLLTRRRIRDPNVPFRLFRRSLWAELRPLIPRETLAPSIFVVVGALVHGHRTIEVPVTHRPRQHGTSSLRSLRLVRFGLRGLGQLLRFRYELARTHRTAARSTASG